MESKKEMALISAGDNKLRAIQSNQNSNFLDPNQQKAIIFEINEQKEENPLSQFFCGVEIAELYSQICSGFSSGFSNNSKLGFFLS